jgi:hypothetical protein
MTDYTTLQLPAVSALDPTDAFDIVQNTGSTPEDRHVHLAALDDYLTLTLEGQVSTLIARAAALPLWLDYYNTQVVYGNSVAKTTLRQYSVPANTLWGGSVNHVIYGKLLGTIKNNEGNPRNLTLELMYGATALSIAVSIINNSGNNAYIYYFAVEYWLAGNGSASVQAGAMGSMMHTGIIPDAPAAGMTQLAGAENSALAKNVTISGTWSAAHAQLTMTVYNHQAWVL